MGTFRVGCKVVNIADPKKSATVEKLLVDPGSGYTWLPAELLEKIGVTRRKNINLTTSEGEQITRSVGFVALEVDEFTTVDEAVFAGPNDLPRLGARTLSGFNARVDAKQKRLVPAAAQLVAAGEIGDEVTLLSEAALEDWLRPEEDEAWKHLAKLPDLDANRDCASGSK